MEMLRSKNNNIMPPKDSAVTAASSSAALSEVHRGLKAITFYPNNHPLRDEILGKAYQAVVNLMKEGGVSLVAQRNSISFADRDVCVENNPMTSALGKELFAREIQQLTLMPELTFPEFTEFLSLLATEPHRIIEEGGMGEALKNRGIQTIIANEIDITAVFSKKMVNESTASTVTEATAPHENHDQSPAQIEGGLADALNNLEIEELISLMGTEPDDSIYRQLAHELLIKAQPVKKDGNFDRLFSILLALLDQNGDKIRSPIQCECALMVFHQLAMGEMAGHLLDHLEDTDFVQQDIVYRVLKKLEGEGANAVIRRLVVGNNLSARKALATALLWIGPPALPHLLDLLKDNRWQVVRTSVTILGDMGNREATQGLAQAVYHSDDRVRLEAVRSLARIGGREATLLLIDLLQDKNQVIRKQAILWMGNTRNEKALQPLLNLVMKRGIQEKSLAIKKEALLAIGRIGDQRALEPLFKLVRKRHVIARGRWEKLKLLAVDTIGRLGGESAKEFLEKLSARGGRIGLAGSETLETMGLRTPDSHE
jgi:HEAT repeat protein